MSTFLYSMEFGVVHGFYIDVIWSICKTCHTSTQSSSSPWFLSTIRNYHINVVKESRLETTRRVIAQSLKNESSLLLGEIVRFTSGKSFSEVTYFVEFGQLGVA